MTDALLISNVLVWVALCALALAVLALARQIGVLHERIRPVGALSLGKTIAAGAPAPEFDLPGLAGGNVHVGGIAVDGHSTLLFFLTTNCPVCKTLLPVLPQVCAGGTANLVLASDGDADEHRRFAAEHRLERWPYVLSAELGMAYRISKLPYAVLIGRDGLIAAHGLVNNREHLESLFEAQRLGVSSAQMHHRQQHTQPPGHALEGGRTS